MGSGYVYGNIHVYSSIHIVISYLRIINSLHATAWIFKAIQYGCCSPALMYQKVISRMFLSFNNKNLNCSSNYSTKKWYKMHTDLCFLTIQHLRAKLWENIKIYLLKLRCWSFMVGKYWCYICRESASLSRWQVICTHSVMLIKHRWWYHILSNTNFSIVCYWENGLEIIENTML